MNWTETKTQRERDREWASERADDSWELLSDGNWTPTCCSLGSLLMNRRERGQRRRDGKEDRRKPSCVMYGHGAKASISFTKPLSMSNLRLNNLLLSPGEKGQEATLTPPSACSLLSSSHPPFFFYIRLSSSFHFLQSPKMLPCYATSL